MSGEPMKLVANNKKAYHDYFIEEKHEAGIVLHGTEVKSMRMGKCSIKEAFIRIENGEVFVYGMHVSPYEKGNIFNKDPLRVKKLLLHKQEINKLMGKKKRAGVQPSLADRAGPRPFSLSPAFPGRTQDPGYGLGRPDQNTPKSGRKQVPRYVTRPIFGVRT